MRIGNAAALPFIENGMFAARVSSSPRCPRAVVAILLLVCAAGCRGVAGRGDDWATDASSPGAGAHASLPATPDARGVKVSSDSSPLGTLLSGLLGGDASDRVPSRRRYRMEPTPVVTDQRIGFGLTVHW